MISPSEKSRSLDNAATLCIDYNYLLSGPGQENMDEVRPVGTGEIQGYLYLVYKNK